MLLIAGVNATDPEVAVYPAWIDGGGHVTILHLVVRSTKGDKL
jgi:hypothetical protein